MRNIKTRNELKAEFEVKAKAFLQSKEGARVIKNFPHPPTPEQIKAIQKNLEKAFKQIKKIEQGASIDIERIVDKLKSKQLAPPNRDEFVDWFLATKCSNFYIGETLPEVNVKHVIEFILHDNSEIDSLLSGKQKATSTDNATNENYTAIIQAEFEREVKRFTKPEMMEKAINETITFFANNKHRADNPISETIKAKDAILLVHKAIKINTGRASQYTYKSDTDYNEFIKSLYAMYEDKKPIDIGRRMEQKN